MEKSDHADMRSLTFIHLSGSIMSIHSSQNGRLTFKSNYSPFLSYIYDVGSKTNSCLFIEWIY